MKSMSRVLQETKEMMNKTIALIASPNKEEVILVTLTRTHMVTTSMGEEMEEVAGVDTLHG